MASFVIIAGLIGNFVALIFSLIILIKILRNRDLFSVRFFLKSDRKLIGFIFFWIFFLLLFFGQTITVVLGMSNLSVLTQAIVNGTTFENIYIDSVKYTALLLFLILFFLF